MDDPCRFVGDQEIEVEAGSYAALPRDIPHGIRVRGDEVELLVTLLPAGTEHFLVARDDSGNDPAKFGLEIVGAAPTASRSRARAAGSS